MDQDLRLILMATAAAFSKATGIGLSTVSRRCRNDSGFFHRLSDPAKSFTARTFDEVMLWFSENWPDESEWPASIARPSPHVAFTTSRSSAGRSRGAQ